MPFEWPAPKDVLYRLTRLRRLVVVTVLLPLSLYMLLGALGASEVGGSLNGLIVLTAVFAGLLGSHVVLFPNAYGETLILSVVLAYFAIFATFFAGSILGWIVFLAFSVWLLLAGQGKLAAFQLGSRSHKPSFRSKVLVRAKLHEARDWFPLRPETVRGEYRCGPMADDGRFPVWFKACSAHVFDDLFEDADQDDAGETPASFWVRIDVDEPDYQRTVLGREGVDGWQTETIVEHRFRSTKLGNCVVTETDTPASYPIGQSVTLWLNDYQKDGLVYLADLLEQRPTSAIRGVHRWSLLTLLGRWFAKRQVERLSQA